MFYLCYMYKFYKGYLRILVVNTISVSFNSNTRRGAGTAYPSEAYEITTGFSEVCVA
jgi:hypothetical protein